MEAAWGDVEQRVGIGIEGDGVVAQVGGRGGAEVDGDVEDAATHALDEFGFLVRWRLAVEAAQRVAMRIAREIGLGDGERDTGAGEFFGAEAAGEAAALVRDGLHVDGISAVDGGGVKAHGCGQAFVEERRPPPGARWSASRLPHRGKG